LKERRQVCAPAAGRAPAPRRERRVCPRASRLKPARSA